jgi:hypothetical protein
MSGAVYLLYSAKKYNRLYQTCGGTPLNLCTLVCTCIYVYAVHSIVYNMYMSNEGECSVIWWRVQTRAPMIQRCLDSRNPALAGPLDLRLFRDKSC